MLKREFTVYLMLKQMTPELVGSDDRKLSAGQIDPAYCMLIRGEKSSLEFSLL